MTPSSPADGPPPSTRPRSTTRSTAHPPRRDGLKPGSLLGAGLPRLLDEHSDPDFRAVYGHLSRQSGRLDVAIGRIRLSGLDLRPEELERLERIRVLLCEVNAITLRSEAEAALADPDKAASLQNLVRLMDREIIEVRSAPLAGWAPDFSVFHRNGHPWMVLVGLHWFARPFPHGGPALASIHGTEGAGRISRRFVHLWNRAHDIGPAILHILNRARLRAGPPSPDRLDGVPRDPVGFSPPERASLPAAGPDPG